MRDIEAILVVFAENDLNLKHRTAILAYIPCPIWTLTDGTEIHNEQGGFTPHYWSGYLDRLLEKLSLPKRGQVVVIPQHGDQLTQSYHIKTDLPLLLEDLTCAGFTPWVVGH